MKNSGKYLWGVVLIILGVIIGINSLGIADIDIFFDGWWTLFILVPSFIGLFTDSDKKGHFIGLVVGGALLLACQGIIQFELIAKLILPFILIVIGLSFIFNEGIKKNITKKIHETKEGELESIVATFAEQKIGKENEKFKGAVIDSIFGGVVLDLRKAKLEPEVIIKANAIFGGITIKVPEGIQIKIKATPIFGGVSNKVENKENSKTVIYLDATAIFGGVDIK